MSALTIAVLMAFAVLTVWGAVAPRGQWRVLAGWTRREPYAHEPGPVAVGVHRLVAIVATAALVFAAFSYYSAHQDELSISPTQVREDPVIAMWGSPAPVVLDRIVRPLAEAPAATVEQPVLNYQAMNGPTRSPSYLFSLKDYSPPSGVGLLGAGLAGTDPSPGLSALDTSYLVVHVRADPNCIPRAIVVVQGDVTVSVGVFYARPMPAAGQPAVDPKSCVTDLAAKDSISTLIPIPLEVALEGRQVVRLDGVAVPEIKPKA